jgi:hypothetical protein
MRALQNGDFTKTRGIPTDVLNFDVANQIWAAFLTYRERCVCEYGVSGGGKTMAIILASKAAAEYQLPSGKMYEPFVVYVPLQEAFEGGLNLFEKKWSKELPIFKNFVFGYVFSFSIHQFSFISKRGDT